MSTFEKYSLFTSSRWSKSAILALTLLMSACSATGQIDQGLVFGIEKETLEQAFPGTISRTEFPNPMMYITLPDRVERDVKSWFEPEGLELYPDFKARLTAYKGAIYYSASRLDEADALFALALTETEEFPQSCSAEQTRILALLGKAFVAASRTGSLKSEEIRKPIETAAIEAAARGDFREDCAYELTYLSVYPFSFLGEISVYNLRDYTAALNYFEIASTIAEKSRIPEYREWVYAGADQSLPMGYAKQNGSRNFEALHIEFHDKYVGISPADHSFDLKLTQDIWLALMARHY